MPLSKQEVLDKIHKGESFNNIEISDINFSDYTFNSHVNFEGAIFTGNANFSSVIFEKSASFEKVTFQESAFFNSVIFRETTNFTQTTFLDNVSFNSAIFNNDINFSASMFTGIANFSFVKFKGEANFYSVFFLGEALFSSSKFNLLANFDSTKFSNLTYFYNTFFDDKANFKGTKTNSLDTENLCFYNVIDWNSVRFLKPQLVNFTCVDFSKCLLSNADFSSVNLVDIIWAEKRVPKDVLQFIAFIFINILQFVGKGILKIFLKLIPLKITHRQLLLIEFVKNKLFSKLFIISKFKIILKVKVFLEYLTTSKYTAIYDEIILDLNDKKDDEKITFPLVENAYRRLKKNFENCGNYSYAGIFHFGEMEMKRLSQKPFKQFFSLIFLYKYFSGYGEMFRRSFKWLIALIFIFSYLYLFTGLQSGILLKEKGENEIIEYSIFSDSTTRSVSVSEFLGDYYTSISHSFDVITLKREKLFETFNDTGRIYEFLQFISVTIFVTFTILTLKRKFHR